MNLSDKSEKHNLTQALEMMKLSPFSDKYVSCIR